MAAGEPVERRNDLFGSAAQLAARLCSHAEPWQVLVSNVIAGLCIGKVVRFADMGELQVRGWMRLYGAGGGYHLLTLAPRAGE